MNTFESKNPFVLECGETLPELTIAYHTYGNLNEKKDNVVWICHALTGNSDAADWWQVVTVAKSRDETVAREDIEFVRSAFDMLPQSPFDQDSWKAWTNAVKAHSGRAGRSLYMPLRTAITGRSHGPELAALLPLIGREETLARRP